MSAAWFGSAGFHVGGTPRRGWRRILRLTYHHGPITATMAETISTLSLSLVTLLDLVRWTPCLYRGIRRWTLLPAGVGPGSLGPGGWRPLWQRPFSTYKSPKFYLSFTILVSFILVTYPDRIGLVNTVGTVPTVPVGSPRYWYSVCLPQYLRYLR